MFFLDYNQAKSLTIKRIKYKKISIQPLVVEIEKLTKELEILESDLNLPGLLHYAFSCSLSSLEFNQWDYLKDVFHNGTIDQIGITASKVNKLNKLFDGRESVLSSNFVGIQENSDFSKEFNNILESFTREYANLYLHNLKDDNNVCPLCGSPINSLKKCLEDKLNELSKYETTIFKDFLYDNAEKNKKFFNNLTSYFSDIGTNKDKQKEFCEYMLISGKYENKKHINSLSKKIKNIKNKIVTLQTKAATQYSSLKSQENEIKELFKTKFDFKDVTFDDSTKEVVFTLKRSIETYSTGEQNYIIFLLNLYMVRGSNSKLVVIDDPLCSYDIPNQYRIMWDIVDQIMNDSLSRKTIIFTHNPDCLNIASSQHSKAFSYFYMEKLNQKILIQKLKIKEGKPAIKTQSILTSDTTGYLSLNKNRERKSSLVNKNKIFHYDESYSGSFSAARSYSNDYLADLIEHFNIASIRYGTFYQNIASKSLHLIALRVWVEKKMYDGLVALGDTTNLKKLRTRMLNSKINLLLPKNSPSLLPCYANLTRQKLMKNKSMLNISDHFESQIMPFYYAMNISFDSLADEINQIKQLFI